MMITGLPPIYERLDDLDKPHEECGVFGIYAPGEDVSRLTFFGLYALQHRGQESAGIAASDGRGIALRSNLGLVSQAFDEDDLKELPGHIAVGHTRYSTSGSNNECNVGPMLVNSDIGQLAVSHNGNLTNAVALRRELEEQGVIFEATTDSEVVAKVIATSTGSTVPEKLRHAMPRLIGAYSLAIMSDDKLYGVRDPQGVRPLCLGRLGAHPVIASESCALMTIGAEYDREIEPGEIIEITEDGVRSLGLAVSDDHAMCLFELIYFARPDSFIQGSRLHALRQRLGEQLAREAPVDADVVIDLPDSATPGAIGFARESGIPYQSALIKNRYIGRTFIQPDQHLRSMGVSLKFNVLPEAVEGKRVVMVDDTIVRGTTSRPIVNLIRQAGAKEVHVRVHAPPMKWPCYLGVDLAKREELIAAQMSVPDIARHIGADSIAYLSLEGLFAAIGRGKHGFCTGCLTGNYPVPTYSEVGKLALEAV